jgi:hypothetical protein
MLLEGPLEFQRVSKSRVTLFKRPFGIPKGFHIGKENHLWLGWKMKLFLNANHEIRGGQSFPKTYFEFNDHVAP